MRLYSKRNVPRVKTHVIDYKKVEVDIIGTYEEIHNLRLFCEENGLVYKIKKTIFNDEIRIVCSPTQLTHIALKFF